VQDIRRFQAVLLAAVFLAGCGDSKQAADRKRLDEEITAARARLGDAISILGRPTYIAGDTGLAGPQAETLTLKPGTPAASELGSTVQARANEAGDGYLVKLPDGQERNIPASQVLTAKATKPPEGADDVLAYPPAVPDLTNASDEDKAKAAEAIRAALEKGKAVEAARVDRAGTALDEAREVLLTALKANPDAPASAKADARQLLGEIEATRARALVGAASEVRAQVASLHLRAMDRIAAARDQGMTADYHRALGQAPRDKLNQLVARTKQRRDAARNSVKRIDGQIAKLTDRIAKLAEKNKGLLAESTKRRAESDLATGRERLDKLHAAQAKEREIHANNTQADAARDEIANLRVDKTLQAEIVRAAERELAELAKRLAAMDEAKKVAEEDTLIAGDEAERTAGQACKLAEDALGLGSKASALEKRALAALDRATAELDAAARHAREVVQAARQAGGRRSGGRNELLEGLADEKHLALILGSKASAHLLAGDVRSEGISAARRDLALAKAIADLAGKLGIAEPVVVGKGREAGQAAGKAHTDAVADYTKAEADFEKVLSSHLRDRIGRNIQWMYQGRLASAYLGHYRLTGDKGVLAKAKATVDKATEGKAESPYLASVFRLKALIDAMPSN